MRVAGAGSPSRLTGAAGMATVELALAIPVLVAVTALALWAASLGRTALVLGDLARDAARAIARGEAPRPLPDGIQARRIDEAGLVTVELAQDVALPWPSAPGIRIAQRATALAEASP